MTKCFKLLLAAVFLLCFAESSFAQGSLIKDIAWRYTTSGAFPAPGATITVCTSTATGAPCSPKVSLFSDAALTVSVANPLPVCSVSPQTGCIDGLGNWSAYVSPGGYTYSASGAGLTAYGPVPIYASVIQGGPASFTSLTVSGTTTLNGTPSVNLLATGGDTAALYGVNNANLSLTNTPVGATTFTDFRQYCPPTNDPRGNFGCGVFINRWLAGQDETNFFFQSPFNTGVVAYNSGLTAAITSISRSGNVVTVNTASQVSLRPTTGDVNIAGVTGCATSPNGHFVPTVVSATQFTYPQTAANETCTPGTGTASPAGRATFVLQRNDNNNNVFQTWYIANDSIGDRSDQLGFTQLPADAVNGAGRFRITMVNPILNSLGVGNAAPLVDWQELLDGNLRVAGSVISQSSPYLESGTGIVSGIASFGLRLNNAKTTWISAEGGNANGTTDITFNATRGAVSNGFYRFLMDGSGGIWVNSSDASAFIPADFLGGVKTGTTLIPETVNTVDVGTAALPYRALWVGSAATNNTKIVGTATAARIATFPDASGTVAFNPPAAAGTTDLGTTALPFGNLWLGTAATNNFKFQPAATAAARTISIPDPLGNTSLPLTIANGTAAMTTAGIVTAACGTTVTVVATGVLTTDVIDWARNAAATIANGGGLTLNAWPTAGNVNFNYCNSSAGTITPTAMTVNWSVRRP